MMKNNNFMGKLSIALYPMCLLSKDGNVIYCARVVNREKAAMSDIANDLVADGRNCGLTVDEIMEVWSNICQARLNRLKEGISSEDDIGVLYPTVKGAFTDDQMPFTKGTHSISVQLRPSAEVAEAMGSLTPVLTQGNTCHPVIDRVHDMKTGTDTMLTPGGLLTVTGKNICVTGDDASVGLYFESILDESDTVKVAAEDMGTNSRNTLCLIIPSGLKADTRYRLKLVTQFRGSGRKKLRKEPQTTYSVAELQVSVGLTA